MNTTKYIFFLMALGSSIVIARDLNFTVTNLSKSVVTFASTDIFDSGTAIFYNETRSHTYNHPPKNIIIYISNGAYGSFYAMTDKSCDALGFPPLREMTLFTHGGPIGALKRYDAGTVHVTISDMEGSTSVEKKLSCSQTITP